MPEILIITKGKTMNLPFPSILQKRLSRTMIGATCVATLILSSSIFPQPVLAETQLILLGTAGGPSIKKARAQPANALIVDDRLYIIDAGNGVARQLALAGIDIKKLRAIFITHNHSDHMADYGTLLLRAASSGLKNKVDTFGPPPLSMMNKAFLAYADWDVQLRVKDEAKPELADMIKVHEITTEGIIYKDEKLSVTAFEVPHGAAKPAYGFRFETKDKTIIFSGDTSRSENLIKFSKDADILVHEIVSLHGAEAIGKSIDPGNKELVRHIVEAHTKPEEVGEVATAAGVMKLVLNHFVPTGLKEFDNPEIWIKSVRKTYQGEIIVGEDLLIIK